MSAYLLASLEAAMPFLVAAAAISVYCALMFAAKWAWERLTKRGRA